MTRLWVLPLLVLPALATGCGDAEELNQTTSPSANDLRTPSASASTSSVDWVEYVNEGLGFAVQHPASWRIRDVSSTTGPNPQWVIDIRDPDDSFLGMSVVRVERRDMTLKEWATENYCDPAGPEHGGLPIDVAGTVGMFCWQEVLGDLSDRHVIFESGDYFFDFQTSEGISDENFQRALNSFRLTTSK